MKTRAQLAADDQNIYLPDNATQDIDPEHHRESNIEHSNANINQLDDNIFPVPLDDSLEYGSDPTVTWDESAIHDLKLAPKKYVDSRTSAKDVTVYYVSVNGNDVTAQPGNDKLPFETIQGAVDQSELLPSGSRVIIKVFPGEYNEEVNISFTNEILLDIQNVNINGRITTAASVDLFTLISYGAYVEYSDPSTDGATLSLYGVKNQIYGGQFIRSGGSSFGRCIDGNILSEIHDVRCVSDAICALTVSNCIIYNSYLEGIVGVWRTSNTQLFNCIITSSNASGAAILVRSGLVNTYYNCIIKGTAGIRSEGLGMDSFYNCLIEGTLTMGIELNSSGVNTESSIFKGCTIKGATDVVSGGSDIQLQYPIFYDNCVMIAGSGEIINEAVAYNPGFTSYFVVNNCLINKNIVITVDPTKYKLNNNFNHTL